jgi:hypothetical protein
MYSFLELDDVAFFMSMLIKLILFAIILTVMVILVAAF